MGKLEWEERILGFHGHRADTTLPGSLGKGGSFPRASEKPKPHRTAPGHLTGTQKRATLQNLSLTLRCSDTASSKHVHGAGPRAGDVSPLAPLQAGIWGWSPGTNGTKRQEKEQGTPWPDERRDASPQQLS